MLPTQLNHLHFHEVQYPTTLRKETARTTRPARERNNRNGSERVASALPSDRIGGSGARGLGKTAKSIGSAEHEPRQRRRVSPARERWVGGENKPKPRGATQSAAGVSPQAEAKRSPSTRSPNTRYPVSTDPCPQVQARPSGSARLQACRIRRKEADTNERQRSQMRRGHDSLPPHLHHAGHNEWRKYLPLTGRQNVIAWLRCVRH